MRDLDNYKLDQESKIYVPSAYGGERQMTTRMSSFSIYGDSQSTYWGIESTEQRAVLSEKKIKSLQNKTARDAIRLLIKSFPFFKAAMSTYRQNVNQGFDFKCDDDRARQIVIETYDAMDVSLDEFIEDQLFATLVGGGSSYEIVRRLSDNTIAELAYVDPDTLEFKEPDPNPDQVYQIYQRTPQEPNGILLHDPTNPQMLGERQTYFYKPLNKMGDNPRGLSIFLSALSAAIGKMTLDSLLPKITKNQAFPRGFISPKIQDLVNSGITGRALTDLVTKAVGELRNELNTTGPSESVISSIGMEFIILGMLGKTNIDGATLVNENFLYDLQVALDIPDEMLPTRRSSVLGEQSGDTQWTRWQNILRYYRNFLATTIDPTTQIILAENGYGFNNIKCPMVFDDSDRRTEVLESEAFNTKSEGIINAITAGIFSAEQGFNLLTNKVDIEDLEFESPEIPSAVPDIDPEGVPIGQ